MSRATRKAARESRATEYRVQNITNTNEAVARLLETPETGHDGWTLAKSRDRSARLGWLGMKQVSRREGGMQDGAYVQYEQPTIVVGDPMSPHGHTELRWEKGDDKLPAGYRGYVVGQHEWVGGPGMFNGTTELLPPAPMGTYDTSRVAEGLANAAARGLAINYGHQR